MVQRSARNSFGYDASSLLSLKYQSLSITKFYCKRILLIIQKKQLGMSTVSYTHLTLPTILRV